MTTPYSVQIVCRMGHVSQQESTTEPDRVLAGGICPCPICGARADWVRRRPIIVTTFRRQPPQPEKSA